MKCKMKILLKYILLFFFLILLYVNLLFLIAKIPQKTIIENIKKSSKELCSEYTESIILRDFFADSCMIDIAYRIDENDALKSVLEANIISVEDGIDSHVGYDGTEGLAEEFDYLKIKDEEGNKKYNYTYSYARFWHGYLIYLRPLLVFFTYNQIIIIGGIIFLLLFILLMIETYRKIGIKETLLIGLSLISIGYQTLWLSMSVFPTVTIAMIFSIYLLINYEKINSFSKIFFIDGSLTCFFNWMTFTPITLGLPIIYYYLLKKDNNYSIKFFLKLVFCYSIAYGLTWGTKWILVDCIYNVGTIKNAINQIIFRMSNDGMDLGNISPKFSIMINLLYMRKVIVLESIFIMIYYSMQINFYNLKNVNKKLIFIYFLIGLIPFLVYSIFVNHSAIHAQLYSYRLLILSEICTILILFELINCSYKNNL